VGVEFNVHTYPIFENENDPPCFAHMHLVLLGPNKEVLRELSTTSQSDVNSIPGRVPGVETWLGPRALFRLSTPGIEHARVHDITDWRHWLLSFRATIWLYRSGDITGKGTQVPVGFVEDGEEVFYNDI
jgi:hypothetical protein